MSILTNQTKLKYAKEYKLFENTPASIDNHFNVGLNFLFLDYGRFKFKDDLKAGKYFDLKDFKEQLLGPKSLPHYETLITFLRFAASQANDVSLVIDKIKNESREESIKAKTNLDKSLDLISTDFKKAYYDGSDSKLIESIMGFSTLDQIHDFFEKNNSPNPQLQNNLSNSLNLKYKHLANRQFSYIVDDRNFSILRHLHSYTGSLYSAMENFYRLAGNHYDIKIGKELGVRKKITTELKNIDKDLSDAINEKFYESDKAHLFNNLLRNQLTHSTPNYKLFPVYSNSINDNNLLHSAGEISDILIQLDGSEKIMPLNNLLVDMYDHVAMNIYDVMHKVILKEDTNLYRDYCNFLSESQNKISFTEFVERK